MRQIWMNMRWAAMQETVHESPSLELGSSHEQGCWLSRYIVPFMNHVRGTSISIPVERSFACRFRYLIPVEPRCLSIHAREKISYTMRTRQSRKNWQLSLTKLEHPSFLKWLWDRWDVKCHRVYGELFPGRQLDDFVEEDTRTDFILSTRF